MKITPKDLAPLINAEIEGNPNVELSTFAKIEDAGKGDLTFIANPKYAHYLNTTKASAVLVRRDFVAQGDYTTTLIRVDDPYSTLAELLTIIENMKPKPVGIEQPTFISEDVAVPDSAYVGAFSYIGKGVKLGENVKIYPQVYVGAGCVIGNDTVLRPGVKIYEGCKIGNRCILHSGVVIGADGFGFAPKDGRYEKIPQIGNVVIADDVEVGANTTIDRATFGNTVIGKGTKLDNLLQIGHNVTIGENNVFAAQTGVAGSTHIGDNNRIGGQCGFAGHIKVGNNNEIGAQSGIPNNVGDGKRLMGYPAVDFRQFAKQQVYIRRLEEFFKSNK